MQQESTYPDLYKLFFTGFLQVVLVAINTWQLAHSKYMGALIVGFLISYIWTLNVKKVAFGTQKDRLAYAFGAGIGSLTGLFIAEWWYI